MKFRNAYNGFGMGINEDRGLSCGVLEVQTAEKKNVVVVVEMNCYAGG